MNTKNLFLVVLLVLFSLTSCQNDIEDEDPNVDPRDLLVGNPKWYCTFSDGEMSESCEITISKDATNTTKLWFQNFHKFGSSVKVYATISGKNLTFPAQNVSIYELTGSGTIENNSQRIELQYYLDNGTKIPVSATLVPSTVPTKRI